MEYATETNWKGVNEVVDPASLAEGFLSFGKNLRLEDGKIKNRGGHAKLVITNLCTDGAAPTPIGALYGGVDFVSSTGQRSTVVFGATGASRCAFGTHRQVLTYPAGVTISGPVQAFQCGQEIRVMRGQGLSPMRWQEGSSAFELVDSSTPPSSYLRMANGKFGLYYNNRVWVLDDDTLKPSLVGEFDLYDPLYEKEIDTGSNDKGTGLYVYDLDTIAVTKGSTLYLVRGISGDLTQMTVTRVEDAEGSEAPLGPVAVDGQLLLPTTRGIFTVDQIQNNRVQGSAIPISDPIRRTWDQLDFSRFSESVGVAYKGYYLLAVPMSQADGHGRVLVYSFKNEAWMGFDEHEADFDVRCWSRLTLGGEQVLVAYSKNGYAYLYAWGEDLADGVSENADNPVSAEWRTRGYGLQPWGDMRALGAELKLRTQNAKYSVGYCVDGVNEEWFAREDIAPDAQKYSVIGKSDFDGTNEQGDFFNLYRQDYSLYASSQGWQIENEVNDLDYIKLDLLQDSVQRIRVLKKGRYFQVKGVIKRGTVEVVGQTGITTNAGLTYTKGKTN